MGWLEIRDIDVEWAQDNCAYDKVMALIEGAETPEQIIEMCEAECKRLGIEIRHKNSSSLRWSKATTTFYRYVLLGTVFPSLDPWQQASTWCHEMGHVYQWRLDGRARFGSRYVFRTRWRWIYETQCSRISVAIRERLKINRSNTDQYINATPGSFKANYAMGSLRWKDLESKTIKLLCAEL